MTPEQLAFALQCPITRATPWAAPITAAMDRFQINTPARQAAFLAQLGHESQRLACTVENLNYQPGALIALFNRDRIGISDANKYGRTATQAANQAAIANAIYGGPWGLKNLGNDSPGDGAKFKGRGLIQITGRANYKVCGAALGLSLEAAPELLEKPGNAALSAGWFWATHGCNELADAGNFDGISDKINLGHLTPKYGDANGFDDRRALWDFAKRALA